MSSAGRSWRCDEKAARLLLFVAILVCACGGGCVSQSRRSMTQFLPAVPQTWWPGTREEPDEEIAEQTEPSVTANVAAIEDSNSDIEDTSVPATASSRGSTASTSTKRERTGRGTTSNASALSSSGGRSPSETTDDSLLGSTLSAMDLFGKGQSWRDGGEDQLTRLKAALSDDVQQSAEPHRNSGHNGEARMRVDSLLSRAQRLFDVGRLSEARQTAQIAQELGDSARLDFSPDEERPIDLVNRIDDQLQTAEADSASAATDRNDLDVTAGSPDAEPSTDDPKTASTEAAGNRSWLPGRGRNVFRRDRKGTATDATIVNPTQVTATTTTAKLEASHVSLSLETDGESDRGNDSRAAIVQANRSVALTKASSSSPETSVTAEVAASSRAPAETDQPHVGSSKKSMEPLVETDRSDTASVAVRHTQSMLADPAELPMEGDRQLLAEEAVLNPPSLEEVRPVSPMDNLARHTKPQPPKALAEEKQRDTFWDWTIGGTVLFVCSLLALACYRRGAT